MARVGLGWVQKLPPNQASQEETVYGHGHHLGGKGGSGDMGWVGTVGSGGSLGWEDRPCSDLHTRGTLGLCDLFFKVGRGVLVSTAHILKLE